jgi:co-chaperonin GroES (HSP10)
MNLTPRQDCLFVRPEMEKHALFALLRQKQTGYGVVVAKGPEATETEVGNRILFGEFVGQDVHLEGEDYLVMREEHILGVIDER